MNTLIKMTTSQLASRAYMGDKVFINGVKKSYLQLSNMKGKTYSVEVGIEPNGTINILKTTNVQTLNKG